MANAGARVEPLEGRQLFAATIELPPPPQRANPDVVPLGMTLAHAATEALPPSWAVSDTSKPELGRDEIAFDAPVGGGMGAIEVLTIRNARGAAPLTIPARGLTLTGRHAALFQVLDPSSLPNTIPPGGSLDLPLIFNPGTGEARGVKIATLRVTTDNAVMEATLRGWAGEPSSDVSLGRILSF